MPLQHDARFRLPKIDVLQTFMQTARLGNVHQAAKSLNLTPSEVCAQLAELEATIGRPLFFKNSSNTVLTCVGEQYLRDVTIILNRLALASGRYK